MLRKIITSSLIITPLMASATYAFADPVFYYRHNAGVVVTTPEGPGEPVETGEFVARNIGGNYDVLILGYRESNLAISLFDPVSGLPFYGAESWELVSGSLPKGMTAELSESNETMRFTGLAERTGDFENIVYKVKDVKGNEVLTKPMHIRVLDDGIWLYGWPSESATIKALTDQVRIEIGAGNVRSNYPLTYEVAGVLPSGVTYSNVGGRLDFTGIADVAGVYNVTVTARDDLGREDSIPITFDVQTHYRAVNSRNVAYLDEGIDSVNITTSLRDVETYLPYTGGATWTLASGRLPAGVIASPSGDGSQMVYSGIPTENGSFNLTWLVDDGHGNLVVTPTVSLRVGIVPDLQVVSSRGSKITLDTTTDRKTVFTADNTFDGLGIPNGNWSIKGVLPAGLTLTQSASGAVLSGTPRKPGEYQITLTAKDTAGKIDDLVLTIRVNNGVDLIQSGSSYATLYADIESFSGFNKLTVRNSGNAYENVATKWELISGRLPAGITPEISEDKSTLRYSGSPTEIGTFSNIVWRATDGFGNTYDTRPLTLKVNRKEALELVREGSDRDPQTIVGLPYAPRYIRVRANNTAPGGIHASSWTVTGVPDGMTASKGDYTVTLYGTPKKVGQYVVNIKAIDSLGEEASIDLPVNVVNGLSAAHYNPVSENLKQYGVRSKATLTALVTAENAPYWGGNVVWTHIRGTLPPGITLVPSSDGAYMSFTGSATEQGVYDDIVFRVTDVNGNSFETKPFTFTVQANNEELALDNDVSEIDGYVGSYISTSIAAVNIASDQTLTADNWTISGLPDGIVPTFSNNGKILWLRGTPTKSGSSTVNVSVTDRFGRTANSTLPFNIGVGYRVQGYDSVGNLVGSSQYLDNYVTPVDREIRIENIETGELYTDGATWVIENDNLPNGIVTALSSDGSTMRASGYSATATNSWKYTSWNVALANGFKFKAQLGFYGSDRDISFANSSSKTGYNGSPLSTYIDVRYFGIGDTLDLSDISHSALPPGLQLRVDGNRIHIEGTPTESGDSIVTFTVTDHFGRSATIDVPISIKVGFIAGLNWNGVSDVALTREYNYKGALRVYKAPSYNAYTGPDLTWTLESGALPPGLYMEVNSTNSYQRDLRGYAEQPGTWKSTWRATDPDGNYAITPELTVAVTPRDTLTVNGSVPSRLYINTASSMGPFTVNNPAFKQPIPETDWTITGLPAGMTPSFSNGALTISGTPTEAGNFTLNIQVKDAVGETVTYSRDFRVEPEFRILLNIGNVSGAAFTSEFNTRVLLAWMRDSSASYTASDLTWTLESGALPPGLYMEANPTDKNDRNLRGFAEQSGTWKSSWRATDPDGNYAITSELTVTVAPRDVLTVTGNAPSTLTIGTVSNLGSFTVQNPAFKQPIPEADWTITGLPTGMTPSISNGVLTVTGTPTQLGTFAFNVRVRDASGQTATYSRSIVVNPAFDAKATTSITGTAFTAEVNRALLSATLPGSSTLVTNVDLVWTLESGSMPPGLRLEKHATERNSMVLRGYAEQSGTWKMRWRATRSDGASSVTPEITVSIANRTPFTLSGGSSVTLSPTQSATLGTFIPAGTAFGQGVSSDKWTVTGLPPGFTPQVVNGNLTISGTATTEGTYYVGVKAVDASGAEATRSFTVTVKAPFKIVNNYGTLTLSTAAASSYAYEALLIWSNDGNNNYITNAKNLTLASGSIPPGMQMTLGTGSARGKIILTGIPTATGTYRSRYQVLSSTGVPVVATQDLVIVVQ